MTSGMTTNLSLAEELGVNTMSTAVPPAVAQQGEYLPQQSVEERIIVLHCFQLSSAMSIIMNMVKQPISIRIRAVAKLRKYK